MENKTRTEQILQVMHVLAWIGFIGLAIEAGAVLFIAGMVYFAPDFAHDIYASLDLQTLKEYSTLQFVFTVSFMFAVAALKAQVLWQAILILSKVKLENPFTRKVSEKIEKVSYLLLSVWVVSMLNNAHGNWLEHQMGEMPVDMNASEYLFMAGIVFIISQIFKRGVELQSESDLTV
jgi:hypothetical protein